MGIDSSMTGTIPVLGTKMVVLLLEQLSLLSTPFELLDVPIPPLCIVVHFTTSFAPALAILALLLVLLAILLLFELSMHFPDFESQDGYDKGLSEGCKEGLEVGIEVGEDIGIEVGWDVRLEVGGGKGGFPGKSVEQMGERAWFLGLTPRYNSVTFLNMGCSFNIP